jgi:hypothetical protein
LIEEFNRGFCDPLIDHLGADINPRSIGCIRQLLQRCLGLVQPTKYKCLGEDSACEFPLSLDQPGFFGECVRFRGKEGLQDHSQRRKILDHRGFPPQWLA